MDASMNPKVYVKVKTDFDREGNMRPLSLTWVDDHVYEIDKVLHVDHRPALRAGGSGLRYTVRIGGRESFLFYEPSSTIDGPVYGRWFVEKMK